MAEYLIPDTLGDAVMALSGTEQRPYTIIAGGTDILPARVNRHAWGSLSDEASCRWLDISQLKSLQTIESTDTQYRIGSLVTWSQLIQADLPSGFDALKTAGQQVGGMQIQNRGTLGGNLCNASPAADGVPALLCLDAQVNIASEQGSRTLPLAEFILGNRRTALAADELLTHIVIPAALANDFSCFAKLGARKYLVISIVMGALLIDVDTSGLIQRLHLAIGACSEVAQRITTVESRATGKTISALRASLSVNDIAMLKPIEDVRADAQYRTHAALQIIDDLLAAAGNHYSSSYHASTQRLN